LSIDSLKATRPIHVDVQTPAQIDEVFDAITYEKGAAILRMIESYVGADTFRRGVNAYLETHAYKNATSEDFSKSLSATSGKPVERILPTFVNQPGVPLIDVSLSCANNRTTVTLKQQRFILGSASASSGERWQIPICLRPPGRHPYLRRHERLDGDDDGRRRGCAPWVLANAGAQGTTGPRTPPRCCAPSRRISRPT
jgi:aminopeptidase N